MPSRPASPCRSGCCPIGEQRSAEGKAAEIERTPLGRVATPEDQARVICFLASSDADFVTGVTIDVTGGQ